MEFSYVAGLFPDDEVMLTNRNVWIKWFESKTKVDDKNQCISIDEWMYHSDTYEEDNTQSDEDMEVLPEGYESSFESVAIERVAPQNKKQNCMHSNELTETLNLIKWHFDDIVNKRIEIWQEKGIDRLLPPASKQKINKSTKKANDWFENYKFKGKLKIEETMKISFTRESNIDPVDTAEYIRGARGKGNKSVNTKIKNCLIKQYSYAQTIQSNKTIEIERKRKTKNKKHYPLDDSGSSDSSDIKVKHKRSQRKKKFVKFKSQSGSSLENMLQRDPNSNNISRYISRWNRRQVSSEETDNSDPDDKILENVRKAHTKLVNSLNQPNVISKPLQCTSSELIKTPNEVVTRSQHEQQLVNNLIEKQLVIDGSIKSVTNNDPIKILSSSEEDSEDDILFMSNKKRLRLYGTCFVEEPCNFQSVALYNRGSNHQNDSDDSSTDDFLFKRKAYKPI